MIKQLIEFEFTATHRFANEDIYINDVLYQGKLMEEVGISAMLPDSFYGVEEPQSVTIRLANVDGYFSTLVNSEELRGKTVYIRRNEDGTNTESWRGTITAIDITDEAKITILLKNPDPLQAKLPKITLTTGLWSNVPEKDLGKPFAIPIGYCERVPCIYAGANTGSNYYDYIIGHGPIESLTKLYRAGVEISGTEYTFYDGSQGSPYAGYAFVRFIKEQRDFSNSLFEITADVRGLEMGGSVAQRNFVRVIQNLLSNSTWGLGLSVNTTSFDTAASAVIDNSSGTMAALLCDGDINSQEKAQDILDKLLWACRGSLTTNLSGQYEISIDTYKATSSATFGSGDGYYNNIASIKSRRKASTSEAFKSLTLKYRKNNDKGEFKQKQSRAIFSFGEDRIVEAPFVRDHTTADKLVCYRQKRALNADERLEIEVGLEGAALKAGDRITVSIPRMGITSAAYQVEAAQKNLTTFGLTLRSYAQAIYDYTAGSLPGDETVEVKAAPTQNKITRSALASPPVDPGTNDLWYQTDTLLTKRWSGTVWELVANAYDNTNLLTDGAGLGTTALWSGVTGAGKPADNATVGATWGTNLSSIPTGLTAPSGDGLYFSSTYLGFYKSSAWKTYMDNNGNLQCGDPTTGKGLAWNQSAGTLSIRGSLNADDIVAGSIRGIGVYGSTHATKGSYLTATAGAGDGTLYVKDTTDFPSSGSGWIIDSANDRDAFSWTGKTATTLTGCSGVLAHTVSSTNVPVVVPAIKAMVMADVVNEMRFFGDRGDGPIEELISLGISTVGADSVIGKFGSANSTRVGLYAESSSNTAAFAESNSGYGIYGKSISLVGVYGYSGDSGVGVKGQSINGIGVYGISGAAYGGKFEGTSKAPILLVPSAYSAAPTHTAAKGAVWVTSDCIMYVNKDAGTTWEKVGAQ